MRTLTSQCSILIREQNQQVKPDVPLHCKDLRVISTLSGLAQLNLFSGSIIILKLYSTLYHVVACKCNDNDTKWGVLKVC